MGDWWELGLIAFAAGTVDSVMGGGGMLQVPALFAVFPGVAPAALFGTNKIASSIGTIGAALQYARALPPRWATVAPTVQTSTGVSRTNVIHEGGGYYANVYAIASAYSSLVLTDPGAPPYGGANYVVQDPWLGGTYNELWRLH